jgi:hypothetical protein
MVVFFDAARRRALGRARPGGPVAGIQAVAFSPDGTRFASAGWHAQGGFVDL